MSCSFLVRKHFLSADVDRSDFKSAAEYKQVQETILVCVNLVFLPHKFALTFMNSHIEIFVDQFCDFCLTNQRIYSL